MPVLNRRHHKDLDCSFARQDGVVLLVALIFLFLTSLGASAMVKLERTQTQRAKEAELLFIGDQFRRAIKSYYSTSAAGGARALPRSLDDLLEDQRFPMPVRHLRRMYKDPMTGRADWVPVQGAGGIIGVHSRSMAVPVKRSEFSAQDSDFHGKATYAEWVFKVSLN
jgi:type II secretory pathway pseudopilin PulG